jgi:hypothetical protein
VTGAALVGVSVAVGTGAADVVGATVVGATVVGATVVGATVVGATVVGATVVGATVVGATVVGATVVGATVVGATVVGAAVADLVGVALVLPAAGVVGVVPDAEVDGCTTGPTVVPLAVVVGLIRALMIGESPVTVPDRFVEPPITFGLPPELPLAFAWAAAWDPPRSPGAAGQLAALQAMNPLDELPDWDAPIPYQQMSVMAPSTPVPIIRFRTECGRCKSSSFGSCRYNDFPPLFMAVSYCCEAFSSLTCEN